MRVVAPAVPVKKQRGRKALRVLIGIALMALFVLCALSIVLRYAGGWGVPYFSFSTDRGSPCVNNIAGYTCTPTTLADVEYFGDVDLPADTRVVSGTYRATHDYQLNAVLEVPAKSAPAALKALNASFGPCRADQPSPVNTTGLTKICIMANDDAALDNGEPSSRVFSIGTGLRKDGTRLIGLAIRSR